LTSAEVVYLPLAIEEEEDAMVVLDNIVHIVGQPIFDFLANVWFGLKNF